MSSFVVRGFILAFLSVETATLKGRTTTDLIHFATAPRGGYKPVGDGGLKVCRLGVLRMAQIKFAAWL